jgi:hypothetical protein
VDQPVDALRTHVRGAISKLKKNEALIDRIKTRGIHWRGMIEELEKVLPDTISDKNKVAHNNVSTAMNEIFGPEGDKWYTEQKQKKTGTGTTPWIFLIPE